jgi:hypothetical protein
MFPALALARTRRSLTRPGAFLEEVAGLPAGSSLPRCASFDEGVRNMEILAAVTESARQGGCSVTIPELAFA